MIFLEFFIRKVTGTVLIVFFALLITRASLAVNAPLEPQNFWAMPCDANWSLQAVQREDSLLAILSPMMEANSWPLFLSSQTQLADANISSPAKVAPNPTEKNHISALAMHALCADVLSTYVNDKGLVDYKTLRRKRLSLVDVLGEFAALDPNSYASWSEADRLAFWINAHNMCTLKAVIDNYPIEPSRFKVIFYPPNSIMQISGFWEKADYRIMGENYSLNEIENKIIRAQFAEPRVCFALSYASLGCAPLRREPYYGKNLDKQLDDQAKIFLDSDKGMKIDRDGSVVDLSAIFQWYSKEFIAKYPPAKEFIDKDSAEAAVLTYVSTQIPKKDSDWLLRKIFTVRYMRYDWMLNEQP